MKFVRFIWSGSKYIVLYFILCSVRGWQSEVSIKNIALISSPIVLTTMKNNSSMRAQV